MEKQIILGTSNREDYFELILEKKSNYYLFLFKLLNELDIKIPDLQDETGKDPNVMDLIDLSITYGSNDKKVIEVIGYEKIFLFVETEFKDKLSKFILDNCEFKK